MNAEDIFGILVPVTFVGFLITERLFPRREYPPVRFWNVIGFGCLIVTAIIGTWLPLLLPSWVTSHHLLDGSRLGIVGGIVIGYPLTALAMALVHRSCHEFHPLWLMGHQVHHSPRRLDIPGSAVFHPLDMALLTATSTIVSVFVLDSIRWPRRASAMSGGVGCPALEREDAALDRLRDSAARGARLIRAGCTRGTTATFP